MWSIPRIKVVKVVTLVVLDKSLARFVLSEPRLLVVLDKPLVVVFINEPLPLVFLEVPILLVALDDFSSWLSLRLNQLPSESIMSLSMLFTNLSSTCNTNKC